MRRSSVVPGASAALLLGISVAMGLAPAPHVVRAASFEIAIIDGAFQPAELTVRIGDPVTWTNRATQTHTVTSDDAVLNSGNLGPGEAYGHVFEAAGVYTYQCSIHPTMVGKVIVLAALETPVASGPPQPTPPAGTLPPNFDPFPTTGPMPTPTEIPVASPSPSAGSGGGPLLPVTIVAGLALAIAVAIGVARRRRRRGR